MSITVSHMGLNTYFKQINGYLLVHYFSGKEEKDAKPLPRINRHSVFWIVASVGITYYVDFLSNIMENDTIKR